MSLCVHVLFYLETKRNYLTDCYPAPCPPILCSSALGTQELFSQGMVL